MNVALLYPEVYDMARFKEHRKEFPPFGVLYLAAVIEQAGHGVGIVKVTPSTTAQTYPPSMPWDSPWPPLPRTG